VSAIRLLVAYDGTNFAGFQRQPEQRTVQGVIEEALGRMAQREIAIKGAGRTDAGVHALGQVVSIDAADELDPDVIVRAMSALLPNDVAVIDAQPAPDGFNARGADNRSYVYLLWRHEAAHPIYRRYSLWTRESLDVRRMSEALRAIVGMHDFTSFGRVRPDQTPERTILEASVVDDAPFVRISITGKSFLHQMVRSIVGTALEIGIGRRPMSFMSEALAARDRAAAGQVAPPHGLTLTDVAYEGLEWPRQTPVAWPWTDLCLPTGVRSCA